MADPGTFHWTEAYKVDVALLDKQHQQLFATVNALDAALRTGNGATTVDAVLDELVNYAGIHFTAEESLLEQHDFPGLSTHRAQHELFRHKVGEFLVAHRAGNPGVPVSLLLFMQTWLKTHVLKTDRLYSAFLNARGIR